MKLLRFGPSGSEKPGILDAEGQIRDLSGVVDDIAGDVLSAEGLVKIAAIDPSTLPLAPAGSRYGPCVGRVGKFICIGLNYADHAAESNLPVPDEPVLFMKATSAIVGPNDEVLKPRGSTKLDWEVELGLVIGKKASYVSEAEALDYVAGYCTINDVSERNFQIERGGTWDKGKGCDTFGPIGPWLVTKDEAGDVNNLHMWLDVNGKRFQNGSTSTMVFKPAFLVHYLSQFMSLHPGDVISTGTPPGVGLGQKPDPIYLNVGDVMELGIEGLGTQKQTVGAA
ncbi:fumarylacetoacetate hydrolase family protein [Asticcacaulis taihuensis]|jgi:2-keto-4-pentenoate hydratase/2-oxohepta-3-ene-1,7-dioic acid hydratase in catechol pathway|uniref:2,4-diketo-3-deoxy-L-fuconate hydrolase n=1 Tax=Asticcacaulis taihuensis TaxID=260084 RepID=A0A1G4RYY7_9CAUL|nr:fumarylacetoacetate hydrolase family protein [Asticcacaulis taihuensis]SCW62104.1 2,4-diketo-3-deoxy-L-fuconate hydrolase [Asticcacaulis taihuensis]